MREITYAEAALEALQEEFRRDDRTVHLATDISEPLLERIRRGEDQVHANFRVCLCRSRHRPCRFRFQTNR